MHILSGTNQYKKFPPGKQPIICGFGLIPRLAELIAANLNDEEALGLAAPILDWFKATGKKKRLGRVIDELGLDTFKKALDLPVK